METGLDLIIKPHIRWMIKDDYPDISKIEERCARECPWIVSWTEDDIEKFRKRVRVIGMVAEYDDKIIGHMVYKLFKNKIDLLNLKTDPIYLGLGIEESMVDKLKSKLYYQRRRELVTWVHEREDKKLEFFGQNGFRLIRKRDEASFLQSYDSYLYEVLEGFYRTPDAYLMRFVLLGNLGD